MPIPFACKCGKRLVAKEEFAGRKMKCPQCAKVLVIPGGAAKAPSAPAPTAKTTPARPSPSNAATPAPATPAPVSSRSVRPSTDDIALPEVTPRPVRPAAPTLPARRPIPEAQPVATRPPSGPSIDLSAPIRLAPAATDKPHPWIDTSLCPTPTPWRPGDREKFQRGIRPMREGLHPLALALGLLGLIGACVGGAFWMKWI
jgi:hypothetical protein